MLPFPFRYAPSQLSDEVFCEFPLLSYILCSCIGRCNFFGACAPSVVQHHRRPDSIISSQNKLRVGEPLQRLFQLLFRYHPGHIRLSRMFQGKLKVQVRYPSAIFQIITARARISPFLNAIPPGHICPRQATRATDGRTGHRPEFPPFCLHFHETGRQAADAA